MLDYGQIQQAELIADKKKIGEVDVMFTCTFSPKHDIPLGGFIELSLPSEANYFLQKSDPLPQVVVKGLSDADESTSVSYSLWNNVITINNFNTFSGGNTILIEASGVKHSTEPDDEYSGNFSVVSYAGVDMVIDYKDDITGFYFLDPFTPGEISFNGIYNDPSNADV